MEVEIFDNILERKRKKKDKATDVDFVTRAALDAAENPKKLAIDAARKMFKFVSGVPKGKGDKDEGERPRSAVFGGIGDGPPARLDKPDDADNGDDSGEGSDMDWEKPIISRRPARQSRAPGGAPGRAAAPSDADHTGARNFSITGLILDKYGYTDEFPGCMSKQEGRVRRAHSAACRARLEAAMRDGDDAAVLDRRDERLAEAP